MNIAIPELQFFSLRYLEEKTRHTWNVHAMDLALATCFGEERMRILAIFGVRLALGHHRPYQRAFGQRLAQRANRRTPKARGML